MLKLLVTTLVMILAALMACTETTPTPDPTETPTPTGAAATPVPPNTPEPTATTTPPLTLVPPEAPSPQTPTDQENVISSLSEYELACIGEDPERTLAALTGGRPASMENQAKLVGCLDDDSVNQLFMSTIVPVALGEKTSACVQAGLDVIDPRAVMTAGLEGNAQAAMGGSMAAFSVAVACLNDEEWTQAAPRLGMRPEDREGVLCIMAALGGPTTMATALTEAMASEGVAEGSALFAAGLECDMEPPAESTASQPARATPSPMPTAVLVITVAEIPAGILEYNRGEWKHWVDEDGDCQDARQEVLIAESLVEVTYEDDRQCRVATGRWYGAFTSSYTEDPDDLDIDHMVPLKNTHDCGGWRWDAATKESYANDLTDPDHLIDVTSRANRAKGSRGPEECTPSDLDYWCQYAVDWTKIKQQWGLTMTQVESEIVMGMLRTCYEPPEVQVETLEAMVVTGVDKPTAEPEGTVYESCEDAAAAGELRVQGNRGSGRGFPSEVVPSARDADGVLCEL